MALHDIFAELEAAVTDGVVERYAIGGAVGATFYIEPSATQDVDEVGTLRGAHGGSRLSFSMDDALRAKRAARATAAARPIAEKLRILERLRERDRAIKRAVAAGATRPASDSDA